MKIVQASDSFFPIIDGPACVLDSYASNMQQQGNDVMVLVPSFGKETDEEEMKKRNFRYGIHRVTAVKEQISKYRCVLPVLDSEIQSYLKTNRPDIIHIHSPLLLAKYLISQGKKLGIPTVITFHTKFKDEFMRVTKSKVMTDILMKTIMSSFEKADYVYTVSNGARDTLVNEYGLKREVRVVRNGTDLVCPDNVAERVKRVNDEYGLEKEEHVFLFVGRMVITKNLALVFDALRRVKQQERRFKMLLVGGGHDLPLFCEMIKECGLEQDVITVGEVSDRDALRDFYLRSDLFLFPSVFDTASLVPIEAAAFSLPTLLVKGSATSEIIIPDQNGYEAEEDPDAWAAKIIEIMDAPERHRRVRENAASQVYRSWGDVAREMTGEYERIIAAAKKAEQTED